MHIFRANVAQLMIGHAQAYGWPKDILFDHVIALITFYLLVYNGKLITLEMILGP